MKTTIKTFAVAMLCSAIAFISNANGNGLPSRWSVGVTAGGNVGPGENITKRWSEMHLDGRIDPMKGWDIGVEGAYRVPMSSKFLFHPSLSLAYRHYGNIDEWYVLDSFPTSSSPVTGSGKIDEFRVDVTLPVGFSVPLKQTVLEFETGPRLGWYLHQSLKCLHGDMDNLYRRFSAQWRFSATCNFLSNRLYAKVAFDLTMSHPVSGVRGRNVLSGGVGLNF